MESLFDVFQSTHQGVGVAVIALKDTFFKEPVHLLQLCRKA